jgi:cysteine desulfurase
MNSSAMIYLDHNATSPLRPEAAEAVLRALELCGNPSSVHGRGREARHVVDDAREAVAGLAGARPEDLIFTSGGTEANASALRGAVEGAAEQGNRVTRLFVSAVEHDSILSAAATLSERSSGLRAAVIPVTKDGVVDVESLRVLLREGKGRAIVAVMAANNETGAIQPLDDIAHLAGEAGALLLVDAVQSCGKIALDFETLGADYLSISAHKVGGPQGVGALAVKGGAPFAPLFLGGGQERGRRAGTENVAGIAGFGAAAKATFEGLSGQTRLAAMRDRFENEIRSRIEGITVFSADASRLSNTSNFAISGVAAETAMMALDLDGICISSGAACSSGKVAPSHVLRAMGVSEDLANSALRISLGWNSSEADIDAALLSLERLAARAPARKAA